MKRLFLFFIVIYISIFLGGCSERGTIEGQSQPEEEVTVVMKIKPEDAKKMLESENPPALIDVREPDEFASGHIPNAVDVPLGDVVNGVIRLGIPKDQPIMVYCRTGRRSSEAASKLQGAGYQKIYDLGGITDWPYEIVK
ncbi:MAG TPA: rhodanese-like domain-containing protein [Flexilinea sp.]|mgnify:FL=1|nr:rhodanese-like domain-containing protein [Flexilinea sp.]HOW06684.1 rhodanese-like domain-containing protein [Flexilinea sp.]HPS48792.1 rhodanese-like domain-containing protein [Flexilinea sp.]